MKNANKTAIVAMSGGIDSSVTALLLKQQGYKVIGLTGKMLNSQISETIIQNAQKVADKLGIELIVFDATEEFNKKVVEYFINSYKKGETPNPCIMCNEFIKWGMLFDYAFDKLKADIFATGHYADIRYTDGYYKLYPAKDEKKDQLYFLYRLQQKQLSKTIFPLFNYKKSEIKKIATKYNLPPKDSKESQDICFIQKPETTKSFLKNNIGDMEGTFVEYSTGKILGKHNGCYNYTIGQRRGIGIAAEHPLYVIDIDANKNIVYVGKEEENFKNSINITNINLSYPIKNNEFEAWVKIRYNMPHKKAFVKISENNASIDFIEPVNSVTKGQSAVIYNLEDKHLIGGGFIC